MMIIGLTGNIGSGKSMAASILKDLGAAVIDADQVARQIVLPNSPAWQDIKDFFGEEYLLADGNIDRKKLGERVFSSAEDLQKLNSITHPRIFAECQRQIKEYQSAKRSLLVLEAALLLDTDFWHLTDEIWIVKATAETVLHRLSLREGWNDIEAQKRLSAQTPWQEQKAMAKEIIDNDGSVEDLRQKMTALYNKYSK